MIMSTPDNQTFREDANWADITERNGAIRSHPVKWLAHGTRPTPVPVN